MISLQYYWTTHTSTGPYTSDQRGSDLRVWSVRRIKGMRRRYVDSWQILQCYMMEALGSSQCWTRKWLSHDDDGHYDYCLRHLPLFNFTATVAIPLKAYPTLILS